MISLLRADAHRLPLADGSIDLVVTSPPYFAQRVYTDGGVAYDGQVGAEDTPAAFLDALVAVTVELVRVLKPSGSIWVNLGDKYATSSNGTYAHRNASRDRNHALATSTLGHGVPRKSLMGLPWRYALRCIDDLGLVLRAEVIWAKPNALPESVVDRVRRTHEQWFHFTTGRDYYADVDAVRDVYMGDRTPSRRVKKPGPGKHAQSASWSAPSPAAAGRPGSVWTIPSQPLTVPAGLDVDHYAAYPMEGPRRIITGWSPPGGVVLDPFGGTGTTALVAHALGRHGVSVDLSADYCRLAAWRTTDRRQLAAALEVTRPAVVSNDQGDLLEGLI